MPAVVDLARQSPYLSGVAEDLIRDAVVAECKKRGLNAYQLWKLVKNDVSRTTVHQFLAGETSLKTETATHILKALGISLLRKK